MPVATHPNLALLSQLDLQNLDACEGIFADNFVWHYFNPKLPDLEGDYRGVEGLKNFFNKVAEMSNSSFQVKPIEARAIGDELIVVHACDYLTLEGNTMELDVVVVWRMVNGKIAEAWDIPSAYNLRAVK